MREKLFICYSNKKMGTLYKRIY